MTQINGHYDPRFEDLAKLLTDFIGTGEELGASICVNLDGEDIVDIWAGYADEDKKTLWQKDTITNVWSTTKTLSSLAMFVLVERGLVDLEEHVATYWPEFAANGKEKVKIKHIISHTSGVSGWDEPVDTEIVCDFDKSAAMLAAQAPWWEPGTASGYHSLTMGYLIGGVVKRVTGKGLRQFVAEEITGPLGADFQIGCKEEDWPRISNVIPPPTVQAILELPKESLTYRTFTNPSMDATRAFKPIWRNADIGAANGHGNARGVARALSVISLGGTVPGLEKPLLSQKTIDKIFVEQSKGTDLVIGLPLKFWTGYGASDPDTEINWLPEGNVCFWGGWGGSVVVMDVGRRLTISYVMNKMDPVSLGGKRTRSYVEAVYRALNVPLPGTGVPSKM